MTEQPISGDTARSYARRIRVARTAIDVLQKRISELQAGGDNPNTRKTVDMLKPYLAHIRRTLETEVTQP